MPIDTSIPLSIKPPQIVDPFQLRAETQQRAQQTRLNDLRIADAEAAHKKAQLDQQENEQIRQLLANGLTEDVVPKIAAINPAKAKVFLDLKAATRKEDLDADKEKTDFLLRKIPMITSDAGIQRFKQDAGQLGFDVSDVPDVFDNKWKQEALKQAAMAKLNGESLYNLLFKTAETPKPTLVETTDEKGHSIRKAVIPKEGDVYPMPEKTGTAPNVGSFEDYLVRTYGQNPTSAQILKARKDYQQADDRPPAATGLSGDGISDIKEAVRGMKDGTIPPQLPGRASKDYTAIMAEAHRQGYDLAGAATDWAATQKHIATMNGAQQLRLNQAINALPDMLDSVDALASKWKAGRYPLLNKANLALAKGGAYGQQAASIANQLDAQIADVVADLGNVYMGGNSPTDHALGLAGRSLKAEWDEKTLHDMVKLAKANVQIRRNSINNTGVQGASPENPYAPPPAPVTKPEDAASGDWIDAGNGLRVRRKQ